MKRFCRAFRSYQREFAVSWWYYAMLCYRLCTICALCELIRTAIVVVQTFRQAQDHCCIFDDNNGCRLFICKKDNNKKCTEQELFRFERLFSGNTGACAVWSNKSRQNKKIVICVLLWIHYSSWFLTLQPTVCRPWRAFLSFSRCFLCSFFHLLPGF